MSKTRIIFVLSILLSLVAVPIVLGDAGPVVSGFIAQFGNVNTGDYSEFEDDGTLVFEGDATVWDDLRVPLSTARTAGSNVPTFEEIGSSGVYAWSFDDGDEIWFTSQMPHSYKLGSNIDPHIHWGPETNISPADNVGLGLECSWSKFNVSVASSSVYTSEQSTGVNTQYYHKISDIIPSGGIDGSGITQISSLLLCRFYRFAASADNYAQGIYVYEVDFHFEIDTIGSRTENTK